MPIVRLTYLDGHTEDSFANVPVDVLRAKFCLGEVPRRNPPESGINKNIVVSVELAPKEEV